MKKIFIYIIVLLAILILAFALLKQKSSDIKICTIQYVEHPNLENVYIAFKKEVNEWAQRNNKSVKYERQIANQDVSFAAQIANRYAQEKPNLILALGTPAAQAAQRATSKIPIVFGAITDPVEIGLVASIEHPGKNITGTIDKWPYEKQFEMIKMLLPDVKSIGVVFNPSESNSENAMRDIRRITKQMGYILHEVPISTTTETYSAAQSLVRKSDIFFALADNTVLTALDAYLKVAKQYHIPLFVGDEGSVEKGGIASFGPNYYDIGVETGKLGVRILNGENPGELSVVKPKSGALLINETSAKYFNIVLPDSILKQAKIYK